jgi:RNA polymerase sigma factor (sigma-70 family)
LTEEQHGLATRYLPMARQLARRLSTTCLNEDEQAQTTAYLALIEAAQTFDSSRKVGFGTYARHRIRGALRNLQRVLCSDRSLGVAHRPSALKLGGFDERNAPLLSIPPERRLGARIEATEAVEHWLSRLPKAHATVCRLIYVYGKSQEEVAAEVGCANSFLSRLHSEAVTWLIRAYHQARAAQKVDS